MSVLDPEHVSRTSLLFMRQEGDSAAGTERHRSFAVHIVADAATCSSRGGQAAILTAVKTAVRALGTDDSTNHGVTVFLAEPQRKVLGGPSVHRSLDEVVRAEGAHLADGALIGVPVSPGRVAVSQIVLGEVPADLASDGANLFVTWSGWTAEVSSHPAEPRLNPVGDGNVLAAIAAAALGVAAAFFRFAASAGYDPDHTLRLDLWAPEVPTEQPPPLLRYAPAQWWLLGLGHLGQAYAHIISWLPYATPAEVEVTLQDVQRTVPANHSTGLLTPAGSNHVHKTRLVAAALESSGLDTTIIEHLMSDATPVPASDRHVALIGVDNLHTRRRIDSFGWRTAIDVGLGVGVDDFDGITVHRFPGRPSGTVPAWQDVEPSPWSPAGATAWPADLDSCGIARLDGTAVGASFVGAVAAVLAVAEALRPLHGGSPRSVQCLSVRDTDMSEALASPLVDQPIALELD